MTKGQPAEYMGSKKYFYNVIILLNTLRLNAKQMHVNMRRRMNATQDAGSTMFKGNSPSSSTYWFSPPD